MGPLPATGQWVRLEVPASEVGLEGAAISGMAFTLFDGRATWDTTGVTSIPPLADGGFQRCDVQCQRSGPGSDHYGQPHRECQRELHGRLRDGRWQRVAGSDYAATSGTLEFRRRRRQPDLQRTCLR